MDLLGRASVEVKKPEIRQHLMKSSVNEGGIITFLAEIKQLDKTCTVTWSKDGTPVKLGARIKTYFDGITATLVINKVEKDDAGVYKVVIKNAAGEAESSERLTVTEK